MITASGQFLCFAALAAIAYNLSPRLWWRQVVLLTANLVYLATFSLGIKAYLPFAAFLAWGFFSVRLAQSRRLKGSSSVLVAVTIAIFIWLKQYSLLPEWSFLHYSYVMIGLSYIFFRVLHLVIDAQSANLPGIVGLTAYLNYTLNFTTLAAGPIQFYQDFAEMQLCHVRPPLTFPIMTQAAERIILGFFKIKVLAVVAMALHEKGANLTLVSHTLAGKVMSASVVITSYTLFLYFNFSGYTDMVIGVARFIRLNLPENFDRPFLALNFIDFWNRWHITLSTWLKTYVYTPLVKVLMQRYPSRAVEPYLGALGFFVTFFLVGVWHGRTSEFLVFGILQGLGVSVCKLYQTLMARRLGKKSYRALAVNPIYRASMRGLTFTWFTCTLIWFWSNWDQIATFTRTTGGLGIAVTLGTVFLGATVILAVYDFARSRVMALKWNGSPVLLSRYFRAAWAAALTTASLLVVAITNLPAPEVVYRVF